MKPLGICVLLLVFAQATLGQTAVRSYFPSHDLGRFLVNNLDLATFRSSLGPRRERQRTFAQLGIVPTKVTPNLVVFDEPDWTYTIRILKRGDLNRDGIEDLELCFTDHATQGSYFTQQPLLVTRYSSSTYAIALRFEVNGCAEFKR